MGVGVSACELREVQARGGGVGVRWLLGALFDPGTYRIRQFCVSITTPLHHPIPVPQEVVLVRTAGVDQMLASTPLMVDVFDDSQASDE